MKPRSVLISIGLSAFLFVDGAGLAQPLVNRGRETPKEQPRTEEASLRRSPREKARLGKDPFRLPSGVKPLSQVQKVPKSSETAAPPSLELKAILVSDHLKLASINRQIVTVGDRIQGERILEIEADRVILEKGGKKRTLFLSQSPVRLAVGKKERKEKNR